MKIASDFILQEIADEFIVVPIGESADRLRGIIRLNETGGFLWKALESDDLTEDDLVKQLSNRFAVDADDVKDDVNQFLEDLQAMHCLSN